MKLITLVYTVLSSCLAIGAPPVSKIFELDVAVKEIQNAPNWIQMTEDKIALMGPQLTTILEKYMTISPKDARRIVERLSVGKDPNSSEPTSDREVGSKIYIFNRLYCNVPEMVSTSNWKVFGGWGGVPHNSDSLNALYPLTRQKNGTLKLTETFGGYGGPTYRGLEEFDFLLKRFGKRIRK